MGTNRALAKKDGPSELGPAAKKKIMPAWDKEGGKSQKKVHENGTQRGTLHIAGKEVKVGNWSSQGGGGRGKKELGKKGNKTGHQGTKDDSVRLQESTGWKKIKWRAEVRTGRRGSTGVPQKKKNGLREWPIPENPGGGGKRRGLAQTNWVQKNVQMWQRGKSRCMKGERRGGVVVQGSCRGGKY